MGSQEKSRSKKRARNRRPNDDFSVDSCNFKTLFAVIQSPEGMKPDVLKNLYRLLDIMCSNSQWSGKYAVGSQDSGLEIGHNGIKLTFADICELSNVLFRQLEERFGPLFSNLCGSSADEDPGESSSSSGLFEAVEVVNLLFRCCMLLLILLESSQGLLLEKWLILLKILRKLSSDNLVEKTGKHDFVFEKSVFRECAPGENGCSTSSFEGFTASLQYLEPYNPLLFLMSTMLEVFVDEVFARGQLREYFRMLNSYAKLLYAKSFNSLSSHGDIGIEAICNHFTLSFSIEQAFEDFLTRLFCTHAIEYRAPALSVTTAVSLLMSPIMLSSPKYIQAHIVSLVSEAICIRSLKPDRKLTNCFLSTFEKSISLYMRHMSCLQTDGCAILQRGFTSSSSHDIAYPPFELYITPETKDKVDSLITKLDNSSNLNLSDSVFRMKSDLVNSSMRFVKECLNAYALSCQDEILAVLSCLVLKASESYDDEKIRPIEGTSLQHIYLRASLLKLMSISLVQAIRCLRHSDDFCCLKTLKDFSSCKEYEFILGTITCFIDLDVSLPFQQVLSTAMSSHSMRHMDSKMMFLHFSGLMSLSFVAGIDCLVKASLLTMLALLNLFIFEEGNLDALQSLLDPNEESFSSGSPVVKIQETVSYQSSSLVVASKFNKIRSLYSSVNGEGTSSSPALAIASHMEQVSDLEEETEETSNGEIFLKCMAKMDGTNSDFDDLVSFVECKPGKDYLAWSKNRQRFRKWKFEKMAVLRWKRKKKTWKTLKGVRN